MVARLLKSSVLLAWLLLPAAPVQAGTITARVAVDMNPLAPGLQPFLIVEPTTLSVEGVAVSVFEPTGAATLWDIGYLGGINRGIAFGFVPSDEEQANGTQVILTGHVGQPVHPQNAGFVESGFDPLFGGAEVQYVEGGFEANAPAPLPQTPDTPIFTVDMTFDVAGGDLTVGDRLTFYVGDMVSVWFPGHGAFSTIDRQSLDTGGDAHPDGTQTVYGVDGDQAVPVPPAAYKVDYVDGPGGALIVVGLFGDADIDADFDLADFAAFQTCHQRQVETITCALLDFDRHGSVELQDFAQFVSKLNGPH